MRTEDLGPAAPDYVDFGQIRHRAFATLHADRGADAVSSRVPLLGNRDVILGVARPTQSMDYFYRNSQAYAVIKSTWPRSNLWGGWRAVVMCA